MNTYTRSLVLAAMAAVSLTQGCSCSSDNNSVDEPVVTDPPPMEPVAVAISGSAAKGLILGGVVNIHPIINGVLSDSIATEATSVTDGSYSVSVEDYDGSPVVVRVTTRDTTQMVCDLAAGCGEEVNFGDTFSFNDPSFNLDAVVPPITSDDVANVNVSVLTDTATEVAINSLSGDTSIDEMIAAISNANNSVANRFGLTGNLTALPIVDLTDPSTLAGIDNNIIQFNMFGSAIVGAFLNDNSGLSIADAINTFSTRFADPSVGLTDNALSDNVTSLSEILASASAIIDAISASDTNGVANLGDLKDIIDTNVLLTGLQEPNDTGTQGTPSETNNDQPIEKAKAMVAVLGDLSNSIEMTVLKDDITIGAQADAFEAQLEAAELASSEAAEDVLEATFNVVDAFGEAYEAYYDDNSLTQWQSTDGVSVAITEIITTPAEGEKAELDYVQLKVGSMVDGVAMPAMVSVKGSTGMVDVAVYMTAIENIETAEAMTDGGMETDTAMGMVGISGTAETDAIKLTVKEGSTASLGEGMVITTEMGSDQTAEITVNDLALNLEAMLAQKNVTDAISFNGALSVMLESFEASEVTTYNSAGEEIGSATEEISVLELTLSGSVMNTSGDKANVVFMIKGDGTGLDFNQNWLGDFDSDSRNDSDPEADNFAAARLTLALEADMVGVEDALKLMYTMNRIDDEEATVSLSVHYDAIHLALSTTLYDDDSVDQTAVLSNQDNVVMRVTDTDDGVKGSIFVGTTKAADIDGVKVTYSDGSFGSLDILE